MSREKDFNQAAKSLIESVVKREELVEMKNDLMSLAETDYEKEIIGDCIDTMSHHISAAKAELARLNDFTEHLAEKQRRKVNKKKDIK